MMPPERHGAAGGPEVMDVADCARCRHAGSLLPAHRCDPHDVCVAARSGRRIDRFFRAHPGEAEHYLADDFWERRAIAARHAPAERVAAMVRDPDEVVRRVVASRLSPAAARALLRDPDREVRITAANRVEAADLLRMADDPDYMVRVVVARRLPHGKLPRLAQDAEREVRKTVARRLPPFALMRMADDAEPEVRRIVAERALEADLPALLADPDWTVRRAAPRWPDMRLPGKTRPGSWRWPMEPGARCDTELPWLASWELKWWRLMVPA